MSYENVWGDKGTYEEVFKATANRMDTDALADELVYFIFEEDLLRWIFEIVPEEFKRDYASAINDATKFWIERHMNEEDRDE